MKPLGIAFLLLLQFTLPATGMACSTPCHGCRLDKIKQNANWMQYYNELTSAGIRPVSCFRTDACQAILVRCYGRGRAAAVGRSNHKVGIAMDILPAQVARSQAIARKVLKGPVGVLWHGSIAYHMSNSASEGHPLYRASSPRVARYRQAHHRRRH